MIVQRPRGAKAPADATNDVTVVKSGLSNVAKGRFFDAPTKAATFRRLGGPDFPAVEARYKPTTERPGNPAPGNVSTPLRINRR
jgi:hypothetical protein